MRKDHRHVGRKNDCKFHSAKVQPSLFYMALIELDSEYRKPIDKPHFGHFQGYTNEFTIRKTPQAIPVEPT